MPQLTLLRNFLTVRQAATRLGLAERTIQLKIFNGVLAAEPLNPDRPGRDYIIPIKEIERYERSHPRPAN